MIWVYLFYSMVVALLIGGLFTTLFRWQGPWDSFWAFLLMLFLVTWTGAVWIGPYGPSSWGVSLVPPILVATFCAILLLVASPRRVDERGLAKRSVIFPPDAEEVRKDVSATLGIFFWVLIALLALTIAWGHYVRSSFRI